MQLLAAFLYIVTNLPVQWRAHASWQLYAVMHTRLVLQIKFGHAFPQWLRLLSKSKYSWYAIPQSVVSTYLHMKLQAELGVVSIVGSGILTVVGFQLRQLTAFLYDGVSP